MESPEGRVQRTGNGWCPALSFRMEINYLINIEVVIQKRSSSQVPNVGCFKLHQLSLILAVVSFQRKDMNQMLQKTPIQAKEKPNCGRKNAATASPLLSCIRVIDWAVSASLPFSSSSCSLLPLQWQPASHDSTALLCEGFPERRGREGGGGGCVCGGGGPQG